MVETGQASPSKPGTKTLAMRVARVIWVLLFLLTVGLVLAGLPAYFDYLAGNVPDSALAGLTLPSQGILSRPVVRVLEILPLVAYLTTSVVLFWRRTDNIMVLMTALLLLAALPSGSAPVLALALLRPAWYVPVAVVHAAGAVIFFLFLLIFPSGAVWPRWALIVGAAWLLYALSWPFSSQLNPMTSPAAGAVGVLVLAFVFGSGLQIARYRRKSDRVERQQTKWVLLGLSIVVASLVIVVLPQLLWPELTAVEAIRPLVDLALVALVFVSQLAIPISLAFAVLRYRLWEIDRLVSRALVYGLLTGLLVLIYFGSVVLLQQLFHTLTGQDSPLAIVVSTLAIAALFQPLRRRLQTLIDRRFYRRKYNAQQTLARFAATARDEVDLDLLMQELAQVVEETMQPAGLSIWLREEAPSPRVTRNA